jgi:GDP-mannose 6-dehydrogenase
MRVSIFGLGYVGSVTAACLASLGHHVIGVDVNPEKIALINQGKSPLVEPDLDRLVLDAVQSGLLSATQNAAEAVHASEILMVCVGTPSNSNGSLDLSYVKRVLSQIGEALRRENSYKVIVLRSTVLPGTFKAYLEPHLTSESGKNIGAELGFVINPEFIREGSAIKDFQNPPFSIIGQLCEQDGDRLAELYDSIPAPMFRTDPDSACMIKYACNAYHALKITFANEIGRLCNELSLNAGNIMSIFCEDQELNISARYLKPGFAFGGSCLPKDLRALLYLARHSDVNLPMLEAILPSNDLQVQLAIDIVQKIGRKHIALIGLSFKPNTDDLRESPMVSLVETLLGKGYEVRIFDPYVKLSWLIGSNRDYIQKSIPHIADLICDSIQETIEPAEVILAAHGSDQLEKSLRSNQILIDLSHLVNHEYWIAETAYEKL